MKTLLEGNNIYVSLSRWKEESKEEIKNDDIYLSSDEDIPLSKVRSEAKTVDIREKVPLTGVYREEKLVDKPKRKIKMNPNAIYIDYGKLLKQSATKSKDKPLCCKQCGASFDNLNCKMEKEIWECQLCKTDNDLKKPIPKVTSSCVRYEVENYKESDKKKDVDKDNASYVIIIDTSGSMSIIAHYNAIEPSKSKSALQLLVDTLIKKLEELAKDSPNARVGIITVNATVTLFGDFKMSPRILSDESVLSSDRKLEMNADDIKGKFFATPISSSIGRIKEKLKDLVENGATALGPALVCGLRLLKEEKKGKLLVFTDGLSNVGIGDLTVKNPTELKTNKDYYPYWGGVAREQGTEVNFYTIMNPDPDCTFDLSLYYPMVRDVDGVIHAVTPDEIKDIGLPIEQSLLGKNAQVKIILPGALKFTAAVLKFGHTSSESEEENKGVALTNRTFTKKYGKLVEQRKDTLHFIIDPNSMDKKEAEALKSLLIHLKLEWTDNNDKRHLLLLTQEFPVQHKKSKKADLEVLKETMKICREDRIRNSQQDIADKELGDLVENYLADSENESVKQLKKQAEETREDIKKSIKDKAVTVKFFAASSADSKAAQKAGTTKFKTNPPL